MKKITLNSIEILSKEQQHALKGGIDVSAEFELDVTIDITLGNDSALRQRHHAMSNGRFQTEGR